jgi:hypothetical protein
MFGFCDFASFFQGYSLGKIAKIASHFEEWVTWFTVGRPRLPPVTTAHLKVLLRFFLAIACKTCGSSGHMYGNALRQRSRLGSANWRGFGRQWCMYDTARLIRGSR